MVKGTEVKRVDVLYAAEALNITDLDLEQEWIMDTGCSYHMTPKKEWFDELNEEITGIIKMGNDTTSSVKGIGSIKILNEDGTVVILTQVRYVPDFKRNLISLGTLDSQGCAYRGENGILKVLKGCRVVLRGKQYDSLYFLQGKVVETEALITEDKKASPTRLLAEGLQA